MKNKNYTILLLLSFFSLNLFAFSTIDTNTVTYDFNNLNSGNLNGQDSWISTKHNTAIDFQVSSGAGYDASNAITFTQSGPSVGVDASRSFASLFGNTVFSNTSSTYIITFDILRNYWGVTFSIGADINNDGKITNSDVSEKAISFSSGSQPAEKLTLPNGTVYSYPSALTTVWTTVEITLSNFNSSASGNISVRSKIAGTSTWNTIANNLNLGIDTTTTDKKNPNLWKMIFVHFEGAGGKFDNISITRIGPQILTGMKSISKSSDFILYPNPTHSSLTLNSKVVNESTFIKIIDGCGREVENVKIVSAAQNIPVEQLRKGIYFYQVFDEKGVLDSGKILIQD